MKFGVVVWCPSRVFGGPLRRRAAAPPCAPAPPPQARAPLRPPPALPRGAAPLFFSAVIRRNPKKRRESSYRMVGFSSRSLQGYKLSLLNLNRGLNPTLPKTTNSHKPRDYRSRVLIPLSQRLQQFPTTQTTNAIKNGEGVALPLPMRIPPPTHRRARS